MIDILYLASNRLEFTKASTKALIANTDWAMVKSLMVYDDNSTDGTREYLNGLKWPKPYHFRYESYGSPVAVMNHAILSLHANGEPHEGILAKIDNDTMVPAGWLNQSLQALSTDDRLDLLGIEAHYPVTTSGRRGYAHAEFIGGIGLMRLRAFRTLPRPTARYGFTAWQDLGRLRTIGREEVGWIKAGWIKPSMPVFLLDRVPLKPWSDYSAEYVRRGWQRDWPKYEASQNALWSWWKP